MQLSVELTFYPFQENYIPPIKSTIAYINTFNDIKVVTFPTASIVTGNFDRVMAVLKSTVAWSYEEFGSCVFVAKFIPGRDVLDH